MSADPHRDSRPRRKRKRRMRSSKRVRFFMLSLGLAGVVMGAGLCALGLLKPQAKFVTMGLIYVLVFASVLFLRGAMVAYDVIRRTRYAHE